MRGNISYEKVSNVGFWPSNVQRNWQVFPGAKVIRFYKTKAEHKSQVDASEGPERKVLRNVFLTHNKVKTLKEK